MGERRIMKPTLKFDETLVDAILAEDKTVTIRYNDEKNINAGDVIFATTPDNMTFAILQVMFITEKHIGDIKKLDLKGHAANDYQELFEILDKYYNGLTFDSKVKIYEYQLIASYNQ